jgi:hypothetical protein
VKGVGITITPRRFAQLYRQLIAALRARTSAQIALCTLTTLGEQPGDPIQATIDGYSTIVRALALQEGLPLIDLRAAFHAAIAASPHDGPLYYIWTPLLDRAAIYGRGQSYASLGARRATGCSATARTSRRPAQRWWPRRCCPTFGESYATISCRPHRRDTPAASLPSTPLSWASSSSMGCGSNQLF